jgi:hypothetical protein
MKIDIFNLISAFEIIIVLAIFIFLVIRKMDNLTYGSLNYEALANKIKVCFILGRTVSFVMLFSITYTALNEAVIILI